MSVHIFFEISKCSNLFTAYTFYPIELKFGRTIIDIRLHNRPPRAVFFYFPKRALQERASWNLQIDLQPILLISLSRNLIRWYQSLVCTSVMNRSFRSRGSEFQNHSQTLFVHFPLSLRRILLELRGRWLQRPFGSIFGIDIWYRIMPQIKHHWF